MNRDDFASEKSKTYKDIYPEQFKNIYELEVAYKNPTKAGKDWDLRYGPNAWRFKTLLHAIVDSLWYKHNQSLARMCHGEPGSSLWKERTPVTWCDLEWDHEGEMLIVEAHNNLVYRGIKYRIPYQELCVNQSPVKIRMECKCCKGLGYTEVSDE
jgi:hypothetical protein